MKPERQKLQHETEEQVSSLQHQSTESQKQEREFESVEKMLQHDAAQTEPPARIEKRLKASLAREPKPENPSWWRRWLGG